MASAAKPVPTGGGQDRGPGPTKEDEVDRLNKELWGTPNTPGAQKELDKANAEVDRYRQRVKDDENGIANLKAEGKTHSPEMKHLQQDLRTAKERLERDLIPAAEKASRRVDELGKALQKARQSTGGIGQTR